MGSFKTLTIKKSVYDELLKLKAPKESFSELFSRMAEKEKSKRPDIMEFAGILSEEEGEGLARGVKAYRARFNAAYDERKKALDKRW